MSPQMKADADKMIAEYRKVAPRWRKARVEAARIQANSLPEGSDRQTYWLYIATSLHA